MSSPKAKKKSRIRKEAARRFKSALSRYGPAERTKFIHDPSGQVRMSEILMELTMTKDGQHVFVASTL